HTVSSYIYSLSLHDALPILKTTLIKVEDAYLSFTKLLEFYDQAKKANKSGIEQPSVLPESVKYGANLYLGSFCYIGENVVLGERSEEHTSELQSRFDLVCRL